MPPKPKLPRRPPLRPLLAIDGDSFAHRAYHALPKTIRRDGDRPAGAHLGFANLLLRLYGDREAARRRRRLGHPGRGNLPARSLSGLSERARFDDDIIEQLAVIPEFVAACGFANARGAGYEADDFSRRGGGRRKKAGRADAGRFRRPRRVPARLAAHHHSVSGARRRAERIGPEEVRARYGVEPKQVPDFHRAARRPIRQIARRARSRPRRARRR